MLFVNSLTDAEQITLEAMRSHHPLPVTRKRAHSWNDVIKDILSRTLSSLRVGVDFV
jgi:hypothetical protein